MGHVACMGKKGTEYRVLVEKSEGKNALQRPKHRWEENIKIGLKFIECVWSTFIWLSILTSGRLLQTQY